jgi:hypothetical protein
MLTLLVVDPVVESDPVADELAPSVSDAVGVRDVERERDGVLLGVIDEVGVSVAVLLDVGVPLSEDDSVVLGVPELLGVCDALAPSVIDGVGDSEREELADSVDDDVEDGVRVDVGVALPVGVTDGVSVAVVLEETLGLAVTDGVSEAVGVPLADAPRESVVDGVLEGDEDMLCVVERLSLPVGVPEGVDADVPVPDPVPDTVAVGDALTLLVLDPVFESEPVDDELAPRVTEAVGVHETELDNDDVVLGVKDGVGVPVVV